MTWKKIIETQDLIVFENRSKKHNLKIEARLNSSGDWEVFYTHVKDETSSVLSKDVLSTKEEVLGHAKRLMKRKCKSCEMLKTVNMELERKFKDEFVEKWEFTVNSHNVKNFFYARYYNDVIIDIVMHKKYAIVEKTILEKIEKNLGLNEMSESLVFNISYFTHEKTIEGNKDSFVLGQIEFKFGGD